MVCKNMHVFSISEWESVKFIYEEIGQEHAGSKRSISFLTRHYTVQARARVASFSATGIPRN